MQHIVAAPDIDELIIAVGSSQYNHQNKSPVAPWCVNPFTFEEREEMIIGSIDGVLQKPAHIVALPDYHNYPKWFHHIVTELPEFGVLYTVDSKEKAFFEQQGRTVRTFPVRFDFHAGILRERMQNGGEYRSALTPKSLEVCDRIGAEERLKDLYARDIAEHIAKTKMRPL